MRLRSVNLNDLQTDLSYQSPVKTSQVNKIVNNYDPKSIDSIVVNLREDGLYYIVDGQHRVTALKQLGELSVSAKVHAGLSVEDEAKLYHDINSRPTKTPNAMAKAKMAHGDEVAEKIDQAVRAAGMNIDYGATNKTNGYIQAYRTLETLYKKFGRNGLTETLALIKRVYGNHSGYFSGFIMSGMAKFLSTYYEDLNMEILENKLQKQGFSNLLAEINKQRPNFKSKTEAVPYVLADIYNKKRKADYKLNKKYLMI